MVAFQPRARTHLPSSVRSTSTDDFAVRTRTRTLLSAEYSCSIFEQHPTSKNTITVTGACSGANQYCCTRAFRLATTSATSVADSASRTFIARPHAHSQHSIPTTTEHDDRSPRSVASRYELTSDGEKED